MMRWGRVWFVIAAAALAGCGDKALTGPGPDVPLPFDTTGVGGAVTSGQRKIVLDVVQQIVAALPGQDFAADTKLLVDYLRALPQFTRAGASADGTVWAAFADGIMLYVVHGVRPDGPAAPNAGPALAPANAAGRAPHPVFSTRLPDATQSPLTDVQYEASPVIAAARIAASHPGTVPMSNRFRLLNAMSSHWSSTDPRADIAAMLAAKGYTGSLQDATLPLLRAVSGDGIFYMRAHGGMGSIQRDGTSRDLYALWTATEAADSAAEARDAQLLDDLKQNRVVYMLFRDGGLAREFPRVFSTDRHYGITELFISHYMSFSDHSLIYIDACQGALHPNFRAAFRNASVFFGWNERALFSAIGKTARYMFDRLLGANLYVPEPFFQRPFDFEAIQQDPKFGKGKTYGYSRATASDGSTIEAELVFHQMGGNFGILAPSILAVDPFERQDELHLFGYFGNDPGPDGTVTIDDASGPVSLAVIEWTPTRIRTDLKRAGPGSAGHVVVSVRGHRSNPRPLLAWSGTLLYTLREVGSLTQRFEMDFRARFDPHEVRVLPGHAPVTTPYGAFDVTRDTEARFSAAGSWSYPSGQCTGTEDWSGSGTITSIALPSPTARSMYQYGGQFDVQKRTMDLVIVASDDDGLSRKLTLTCPLGTTSGTDDAPIATDIRVMDLLPGGNRMLRMSLDDGLNISAGGRQVSIPSAHDPSQQSTLALQWSTINVRPRFDPSLPR